jgi:hypothetical protein
MEPSLLVLVGNAHDPDKNGSPQRLLEAGFRLSVLLPSLKPFWHDADPSALFLSQ